MLGCMHRAPPPIPPAVTLSSHNRVYVLSDNVYMVTQCEGGISPMMLSCPGNRRVLIRSAMFGRRDWNTTCPGSATTPGASNCVSSQSLDVVRTLCNGQYFSVVVYTFLRQPVLGSESAVLRQDRSQTGLGLGLGLSLGLILLVLLPTLLCPTRRCVT